LGAAVKDDLRIDSRRMDFLQRILEGMADDADEAEGRLRDNPTDFVAGRRVETIYALANQILDGMHALRARHRRYATIYVARDEPNARAYRQTLG
jgi:hypothetical protein